MTEMTKFYPRCNGETFPALLYIATPANEHWIGALPEKKLAEMIVGSRGPSGHNVEYLIRLVMFMREELPGIEDDHLFKLNEFVRKYLLENKMNLNECMGSPKPPVRRDVIGSIANQRTITFEHTSRVPNRRLRCLNI